MLAYLRQIQSQNKKSFKGKPHVPNAFLSLAPEIRYFTFKLPYNTDVPVYNHKVNLLHSQLILLLSLSTECSFSSLIYFCICLSSKIRYCIESWDIIQLVLPSAQYYCFAHSSHSSVAYIVISSQIINPFSLLRTLQVLIMMMCMKKFHGIPWRSSG